jgi:hypothetical protein
MDAVGKPSQHKAIANEDAWKKFRRYSPDRYINWRLIIWYNAKIFYMDSLQYDLIFNSNYYTPLVIHWPNANKCLASGQWLSSA